MNKTALLAELETKYKTVGTPIKNDTTNDVSWYIVNVFEIGDSDNHIKPIGYRRNLPFYVYAEGQTNESAYYGENEPINTMDKKIVTTVASLEDINKVYGSSVIRGKINSAIITAAKDVYYESSDSPNHRVRLNWATSALTSANKYIETMMAFAALDVEVQTNGAPVADSIIQNVVNSHIDTVAKIEWPLPDPPSLVSPANNTTNASTSPTLQWSTVYDAESYNLQISTQTNCTNLVRVQRDIEITLATIEGLTAGVTYYWRVQSANCSQSLWSDIRQFTTV